MAVQKFLKKAKEIQDSLQHKKGEKKAKHAEHDESNWLVSYADFMTLTAGFFIMMFAMSTLDAPKYEKVAEELAKHFGGDYKTVNEELAKFVTQVIQESGLKDDVVIKKDSTGVSIVFHSTVFFETLSAHIRLPGRQIIEKLVKTIADRQVAENKAYHIVVEGHTDSRPITGGLYPSNWELSAARATRVIRMFLQSGFSAKDVVAIGYADTRPQEDERDDLGNPLQEAMAKNRRVVIRIMEPTTKVIPWGDPDMQGTADQNLAKNAPDGGRDPANTQKPSSKVKRRLPNDAPVFSPPKK